MGVPAISDCINLKKPFYKQNGSCVYSAFRQNLKVERYLLGKLKFNCNSMSYQATEESAVK